MRERRLSLTFTVSSSTLSRFLYNGSSWSRGIWRYRVRLRPIDCVFVLSLQFKWYTTLFKTPQKHFSRNFSENNYSWWNNERDSVIPLYLAGKPHVAIIRALKHFKVTKSFVSRLVPSFVFIFHFNLLWFAHAFSRRSISHNCTTDNAEPNTRHKNEIGYVRTCSNSWFVVTTKVHSRFTSCWTLAYFLYLRVNIFLTVNRTN